MVRESSSAQNSAEASARGVEEDNSGRLYEERLIEIAAQDQVNQEIPGIRERIKFSRPEIALALDLPLSKVKLLTDEVMDEASQLFSLGVTSEDAAILYCDWEVLHRLSANLAAPEDMISISSLAGLTGFAVEDLRVVARRLRNQYPLNIRPHKNTEDEVELHISPDLAPTISQSLRNREQRARSRVSDTETDFREFTEEIRAGLSLDAQEFKKLVELLGPAYATDLFFHYRPNLTNVPIDYVKSFLADYLGEFTVFRGNPDFEQMALTAEFLSSPSLKAALVEVIKQDCLSTYHRTKRSNPAEDDFAIIASYLDNLRESVAELDNEHLDSVINEVMDYYLALFVDFKLPARVVENLKPERPFPDLNQRINIKEICEKKRMLIADDPGLGKSASAIIAKEKLGAKLAVVIAPSGVLEKQIWQTYLSDSKDSNGQQLGYFKTGEGPRVLEVNSPAMVENIRNEEWDYILISHEKLSNPAYGKALERVGFDMLIIDEAHQLNNISDGKRASQLVELSDQLLNRKDAYTVMLTATPAPNKVSDIAMALRVLYPDKFAKYSNKQLAYLMISGGDNGDTRDVRDLRSLLIPRMQMKSLEDCIDLPMLKEKTEYVALSEAEAEIYQVILDDDELDFSSKMQACRRVLLNPATVDAVPHIIPSKALHIGNELRKTFEDKRKALVFVNDFVTDVIAGEDSIIDYFDLPDDVRVGVIHGDTPEETRYELQQEFQNSDQKMLLVVSGRTSGVGVDFSAADDLSFYNEGWTMAEKRQEIGRCQRPGRNNPLTVNTYIAAGTIEEGIHQYIQRKDQAIRKLLFGVPLSELDRKTLIDAEDEKVEPNADVNPELAAHYFNATQRIDKMFGRLKQQGELATRRLVASSGAEYASTYKELSSRSYQANMARLTSTIIEEYRKNGELAAPAILDLGSGPEMLKQHIADNLARNVTSLDINLNHFDHHRPAPKNIVGSVVNVPIASGSMDVVSLGLVLDSTKYRPSKRSVDPEALERLAIFKEMNRVLKVGGKAIVTQIYSLDLADVGTFNNLAGQMGFKVVKAYSGLVYSNGDLRGRVVTLEKQADCLTDVDALANQLGQRSLSGLKFVKRNARVRNPKKIDQEYRLDSGTVLKPSFNSHDQYVADEEEVILKDMTAKKRRYRQIKNIPPEVIVAGGLSRIRLTKQGNHILFRPLSVAQGAVFLKD